MTQPETLEEIHLTYSDLDKVQEKNEKNIYTMKIRQKETRVGTLISDKTYFKRKNIQGQL